MDEETKTTKNASPDEERARALSVVALVAQELARRVQEGARAALALQDLERWLSSLGGPR